ncbi:putative GEM-like protein 8 [Zingiber officinale]|uniref:putative GEM-like protein 8 n=1 Tax=Zingiber officinale TaxID=94328 RepID=UPI001C4BE015|nr:putative GEM-like protein 8 [Zingiber officinale]
MKHTNLDQVAGLPLRLVRYGAEAAAKFVAVSELNRICLHSDSCDGSRYKQKLDSPFAWMSKLTKKADSYLKGIRDHVSLGSKISETVKGKLSLGAKILQAGGVQRVFRQSFTVEKGEKLLHAFQCYLSTTAGPIAGLLFVSINKIAFCSDQSIRITSPEGSLVRVPYKVLIPLGKVKRNNLCENSYKSNKKYIQIVTVDEFEFWFMGFLCYQRSLKHLRRAISASQLEDLH